MTIVLDGTNGITTPLDVEIQGSTSGSIVLAAPAIAGTNTQTLVAATGTLAPIVSGTVQASTSGTAKDFTEIPSWVKRITVLLSGVSLSGTSSILIQLGDSGGVETSGYAGAGVVAVNAGGSVGSISAAGLYLHIGAAAATISGIAQFALLDSATNLWSGGASYSFTATATAGSSATSKTLSDTLTQIRLTTVNGTDTFDAGSVNILYE